MAGGWQRRVERVDRNPKLIWLSFLFMVGSGVFVFTMSWFFASIPPPGSGSRPFPVVADVFAMLGLLLTIYGVVTALVNLAAWRVAKRRKPPLDRS